MFDLEFVDDVRWVTDRWFVRLGVIGTVFVARDDIVAIRALDHVPLSFLEHLLRLDLILSVRGEHFFELVVGVMTVFDVLRWR